MTIYDLAGIYREPIPLAMTAQNGMKSFAATGTFPVIPDIFTEADFLPSMVTDRPNPHTSGSAAGVSSSCSFYDIREVTLKFCDYGGEGIEINSIS